MIYDTIVVGSGPAGIAASIQLRRAGFKLILLEKNKIGGLLNNASLIENYPGFPGGIFGKDLVRLFQKQLEKCGAQVKFGEVESIGKKNNFIIKTTTKTFYAKSIIVASGSVPKKLELNGHAHLLEKKLFYELSQIPSITGKTITVIGSGDIAFDYALNIANTAKKVNLFIKNNKPTCIPILLKQALKKSNIKIYKSSISNFSNVSSDYFLVAIGREKKLPFIKKNWQKLLAANSNSLESLGLFLAGDAKLQNFRHTAIAVGDGLNTAMKVEAFLRCQ